MMRNCHSGNGLIRLLIKNATPVLQIIFIIIRDYSSYFALEQRQASETLLIIEKDKKCQNAKNALQMQMRTFQSVTEGSKSNVSVLIELPQNVSCFE